MDLYQANANSSAFFSADSILTGEWLRYVNKWRFEPNETPFTQWYWPLGACVFYFAMIYAVQKVMHTRKPMEIPRILFMHNMTLCVASLLLACWLTYNLGSGLFFDGMSAHELLCSYGIYDNGQMQMIYYVNSFFKVWEFLDTFFLAIRKKPIAFLHGYHHAATLILTWNQMMEHSAPQWVPIVLNLWVHVAMYYYYAMSALRIRIWWKKYLTSLQIVQFIIDVVVIGYAYYTFIKAGFDPGVCYGTSRGAIVGISILFSYLILFIRFYFQTYRTPGKQQPNRPKQQ